jgi:hypothetical protein
MYRKTKLFIILLLLLSSTLISYDGDGISAGRELLLTNTEPFNIDSDNDGLTDGQEVNKYQTNPSSPDSDNDGLTDGQEVNKYQTNPTSPDSDKDGLTDGQEVNKYQTNPTSPDSDNDGLIDGHEVNKYQTNPTSADSDNDGLTDGQEINKYQTNPTSADSDNDGLTDSHEVNKYQTNPTSADSDNDGLTDGQEVNKYQTNPTSADSDNDGLTDGQEVNKYQTNPLHKDILIEVDMGQNSQFRDFNRVKSAFENSPVNNPDGEQGINIHFWIDDTLSIGESYSINKYKQEVYDTQFDNRGSGFYHILIVDNVRYDGSDKPVGLTDYTISGALIENIGERTETVVMHEIGHQIGLKESVFDGIDSRTYTDTQYPSTMNYNCGKNCPGFIDFSSGRGFNDWSFIETNLRNNAPPTE